MKWQHWLVVILVIIGGLYLLHNYQMHGGVNGIKGGLGFSGGY